MSGVYENNFRIKRQVLNTTTQVDVEHRFHENVAGNVLCLKKKKNDLITLFKDALKTKKSKKWTKNILCLKSVMNESN